jgi:hypothetical protein
VDAPQSLVRYQSKVTAAVQSAAHDTHLQSHSLTITQTHTLVDLSSYHTSSATSKVKESQLPAAAAAAAAAATKLANLH